MKIRTLIVDDEPLARQGIRLHLQDQADIEVIGECANGAEALAAIQREMPRLIFLDIQMPRMDGYDVMTALRSDQRFKLLPILALTASAMAGDRDHAISRGFTSYLTKPVIR